MKRHLRKQYLRNVVKASAVATPEPVVAIGSLDEIYERNGIKATWSDAAREAAAEARRASAHANEKGATAKTKSELLAAAAAHKEAKEKHDNASLQLTRSFEHEAAAEHDLHYRTHEAMERHHMREAANL